VQKLSVIIITKNEEKNIRACLESVRWADEIVVVDSLSTDGTAGVCRQYTEKVFGREFRGFSEQKNYALDRAANDWVLCVDADETVTGELRSEIDSIIKAPGIPCNGYLVPRKNFFFGKWARHCGLYPDYSVRLFRKSKGRFGDTLVHEHVVLDGKAGKTKGHLLHRTYENREDFEERSALYAELWAQERHARGKKAAWFKPGLNPLFTFFRMFFLKSGFLDGRDGFLISRLYSRYTFLKYAGLRRLWKKQGIKDGRT